MHRLYIHSLFFFCFSFCVVVGSQPPLKYGKLSTVRLNDLKKSVRNMHTGNIVSLPEGYNLLHLAAVLKATNEAQTIINAKKYDINQHDNKIGFTPLFIACSQNYAPMVHLLLEAGADHSITTKKGTTPLIKAVQKQNHPMVTVLLLKGANPNQKNMIEDDTPLHAAIYTQNSGIVELLLTYKASPDLALQSCFTPLMAAAQMEITSSKSKTECLKIVKALLDKKANHAVPYLEDQDTALHIAVAARNVEVVYLLLKAGADANVLNSDLKTPFYTILQNIQDTSSHCEHTIKEYIFISRLLLLYGAQLSDKQLKGINLSFLLFFAVDKGAIELVKFSLDAGIKVNIVDIFGNTPLHFAVKNVGKKSAYEIVQLLLAYGADIACVNKQGFSPFDIVFEKATDYVFDLQHEVNSSKLDGISGGAK